MDPFAGESATTLRACAAALRSGHLVHPLSRMALARVGQCSDALCATMLRLDSENLAPAHMALLLEVAAEGAEARTDGATSADLVWTGPEGPGSHSRDTSVVVEELFAHAQRNVLVSSFVVQQGKTVFKPLAVRMGEISNLRVRLFLHVPRGLKDTRHESELLRQFTADFGAQWPWAKRPEVYYDPRTVNADKAQRATWHAKCVVVDDELAFVTSANFTEWAHQRNVEAGVLIRSPQFVGQLLQQFEGLIQSNQVRRLPSF
ncbi:MAG: DISARM system phospholipase D-like protein DrmC [Thermoanaerobaculia bacterium]